MKKALFFCCALILLADLSRGAGPAGDLRQRGYAGFIFRPLTSSEAGAQIPAGTGGVAVTRVLPDSPAAKAGLRAGDILIKYDDNAIPDDSGFAGVSRLYYAGDKINVSMLREGGPASAVMVLEPFPEEKNGGLEIEYTWFSRDGVPFRAVIASPLHSRGKKLPALLLVSALNSPRLIGAPGYNRARELAYSLALKGFRVLRFELRGSGDSRGEDYRATGFETEVRDNLAALDFLKSRPDVAAGGVFVMGHSTGGQTAAIVAGRRPVAGLIVSCTIGRTYYERTAETVRLQSRLSGDAPDLTDRKVKDHLTLMSAVARGDSIAEILKKNPKLGRFVNKSGRLMDDRTPEYWKDQVNLDLPGIYQAVKSPVLIVYGASDFLTRLACHENIRDLLAASGNNDVTLAVIPGTDHQYSQAADEKESFRNYKNSQFKENPAAGQKIAEWLSARAKLAGRG